MTRRWLSRIAVAIFFCITTAPLSHSQNECPAGTFVPPWAIFTTADGVPHQTICFHPTGILIFPFMNVSNINKTILADQQIGTTAGAQIISCLARVPAGGICDATGYGATTQSIASTITVGPGQSLLFDPSTAFQSASPSLNLFKVQPKAIVNGFNFDCSNQPSYTGTLFQNDTTQNYGSGDNTEIGNVTAGLSCLSVTGWRGLQLNSTAAANGISFLKLHDWRLEGGLDGVLFTSSGTGFVNGVQMFNIGMMNNATGWHLTNNGGNLKGNACMNCFHEKTTLGVNGVLMDGAGGGQMDGNLWLGDIWDDTVPVSITNANAASNTFIGFWSGTPSDSVGLNTFIPISNAQAWAAIQSRGLQVKTRVGGLGDTLDIFDTTAAAASPHKYFRVQAGTLKVLNNATLDILALSEAGALTLSLSTTFASLGTPANGTVVYCSDCNATCTAGGGTGRTCFRENGAWTH